MIKKMIKYKDYDNNLVEKEYCFNLSKVECMDLNFEYEEYGGLSGYLKSLLSYGDPSDPDRYEKIPKKPIWEFLKKIIHASVGRQSSDKTRFEKSEEIAKEFEQTNAYGEFVFSLLDSPGSIPAFISGVLPDVDDADIAKAKAELEAEGLKFPE